MTTTTVLSEDTATIVKDDLGGFEWGAVFAGAAIAAAVIFFLISAGAGLGLSLSSARNPTATGAKTFLTLGAIYFFAAQAFGAAVGGYVTGRLLRTSDESEEEHFRADAHGLAVWALAVVIGLGLIALAAGPGLTAGAVSRTAAPPTNYWADKLFRSSGPMQAPEADRQNTQNDSAGANNAHMQDQGGMVPAAPNSPDGLSGAVSISSRTPPPISPTYSDIKAEAGRLLTAQAVEATADPADRTELVRLVSLANRMPTETATRRVDTVISDMRSKAAQAAEVARKAASYVSIWTALALLFSAIVSVAATVAARWGSNDALIPRRTVT